MSLNSDLETKGAGRPRSLADLAELNHHIERARVLRAEVSAAMLAAAFRALAQPLGAPLAAAARWRQQRATEAALMRCSDRVLADVGIEREDVPLVARGIDPQQDPRPAGLVGRRWPAMLAYVDVLAMIRRGASHGWIRRDPQTVADRA
jgi:uncharacterized protein YjiS (DUF1127 family)